MSRTVLDASVLLAILKNERTDAAVYGLVEGAAISTVNVAEALTKVFDDPSIDDDALDELLPMLDVASFTAQHALLAAQLRPVTKSAGLSLGDRACIALGADLDADIYTADRAWSKLRLPYRIHLIR